MKKISVFCLSVLIFWAFATTVVATPISISPDSQVIILDFEDVGTDLYGHISDGYGELDWSDNFGYISADIGGYWIENEYTAFKYGRYDVSITTAESFTFPCA
ncbi:hypothetical protein K8R61_01330, partial [bacterium]|nr:hypothetical protein [bacterium]